MKIASIALRNIFRNKWRSFLSLSAIALVTFTIVFLFAIMEGMKLDQRTTMAKFATGDARIRNAGFEKYQFIAPEEFMIPDYDKAIAALRADPAVETAVGRFQFPAQVAVKWEVIFGMNWPGETNSTLATGLDFSDEKSFFSLASYLVPGGRLPGQGEILVSGGFAKKFNLKPGDSLILYSGGTWGQQDAVLKISGIVALPLAQLNVNSIYMALSAAQNLLLRQGQAEEILIRFKPGVAVGDAVAAVRTALARNGFKDLDVKPWNEIGNAGTFIDLASKIYYFMAFFFFILGTTVIINTTMMVIYERMREIGTLRAMGMTGPEMIRLFFMEAFFIGAAAAFVGVILGSALILPLSVSGVDFGKLIDLGKTNLDISDVIYPQLNLVSTLFVFFYSTAVSSLISFIPTRRAAKIEPVEALRSI
ncbi:MAG: ABC transporter permease [Spirochaetales bacterium]|nr:ABC transporter permease [Spirochaetales bacterium]